MKLRLLPPLWIVCVPLFSVGLVPHPAVAAATSAVACGRGGLRHATRGYDEKRCGRDGSEEGSVPQQHTTPLL